MNDKKTSSWLVLLLHVIQGAFVGLGAVLPGISGGVLCVIFGISRPVMEFLSDPFRRLKTHFLRLLPYGIGLILGFLGIARLLSFLLERYEAPSICLFIGLIGGMLPSLFREAGREGRSKGSYISLAVSAAIVFALLIGFKLMSVTITPNIFWNFFCGVCLALSVIAPGLSFSTLLMPLGLYQPFVDGIGGFDFSVLIPAGVGALLTVILFAKAVEALFRKFYSISFHAIVGIVIAATVMILPISGFASLPSALICVACFVVGVILALLLDRFNRRFENEM